ncbi:hypothetical protein HNQ64_001898 [Prosthecobacter dejongeii]|uniref:Uncharacterized protein n=1 Tax=Prosthecobacter dejongeii TaxID=48465 RepID=A0A7W7YK96_9BACT|nr:hypothetical protein [Prosthecobacter dejongeii]
MVIYEMQFRQAQQAQSVRKCVLNWTLDEPTQAGCLI